MNFAAALVSIAEAVSFSYGSSGLGPKVGWLVSTLALVSLLVESPFLDLQQSFPIIKNLNQKIL